MRKKTLKNFICAEDLNKPSCWISKPKKKKSKLIKDLYKQIHGWVLWIDRTRFIPIIKIRYNKKSGGQYAGN